MDRLLTTMTLMSIVLIALVLFSLRRAHIRVEYSVSWLGAGVVLLILSRSQGLLSWIAQYLGLESYAVALVMVVLCVFVVVFFRFSVVLSDLKDANIAMAQRLAILEYQLRQSNEKR